MSILVDIMSFLYNVASIIESMRLADVDYTYNNLSITGQQVQFLTIIYIFKCIIHILDTFMTLADISNSYNFVRVSVIQRKKNPKRHIFKQKCPK